MIALAAQPTIPITGDPTDERRLRRGHAHRLLDEPSIVVGNPMHEGELTNETRVQVALSMMNRHGLVAGATGTGKTKTLQLLAGQLSKAGAREPSWTSRATSPAYSRAGLDEPKVVERVESLAWPFEASGHPVEFLSLSEGSGHRYAPPSARSAPCSSARSLTSTRPRRRSSRWSSSTATTTTCRCSTSRTWRRPSSSRLRRGQADPCGVRRDVERIGWRAAPLDGRPRAGGRGRLLRRARFDVADLLRTAPDGSGVINILELRDVMDKPRLFSTFTLWLLAQRLRTLPRPATCQSRSCASSSTRPTCCSTTRPRR